jgi:hypothetical protein
VYDYSKHSSQGNGNDMSSVKTYNIGAPASSNEVGNKLATIQENVCMTQHDSVNLLSVQVGNKAKRTGDFR